ncbi:MAG TPA: pyruvate kinase [Candidatus Paceibacterota bacterium]|nr:pyruvate kinase [Candidatus Paceibacterota bacterium]HQO70856.1 pyruvate kinase [Candidatus Paceibacterota bacterium]
MESLTKIIATVGPASNKKEIIRKMMENHANMFRLNFSWNDHDWFRDIIKIIRGLEKEMDLRVPIMQDLSGPRVQDEKGHHFGGDLGQSVITKKDRDDLAFGIKEGVDYVAMSFVCCCNDILELRRLIEEDGGQQKIIAKIERRQAYENLESILEQADGVLVARGDLGNEFPLEEIPFIQHHIIEEAKKAGKMVIVATEMLSSMEHNPIPTRAEVSDVAYAIVDGADGVMLSEESARGKYPVEAVAFMDKIALMAEKYRGSTLIG